MKKIFAVFCISISLFMCRTAYAQDPAFTQFYANPLYLNPAFAGSARCPRVCLNYRNEWPAIQGTYVTTSASYDQFLDGVSGGVGIIAYNDRAGKGILNTNYFGAMYAYQLNITREFSLKFGLQGSYYQKSIAWDKLTFGDQIDAKAGFVKQTGEATPSSTTRGNPDFAAGILGFSKRYFVGVAAHHLTQPDESFTRGAKSPLPMKITGHAGAVIPVKSSEDMSISPNILFQKQQDFQQLNLGVYLVKGPLVGGLWYRNQDAFILLLGFQTGIVKFGYSYDVTISKLANASAGSHEISLSMVFPCKPKKKKFRTISCPSF